jgi:hypothetical protein
MNRRLSWVLGRRKNVGIAKGYSYLMHATETVRSIVIAPSAGKKAKGPVNAGG